MDLPLYGEAPCPWCEKQFNPNKQKFYESSYYLLMCCSEECLYNKELSMGLHRDPSQLPEEKVRQDNELIAELNHWLSSDINLTEKQANLLSDVIKRLKVLNRYSI